jgi:hypothetical protein
MSGLSISLDLDNTIISYDKLFHELAVERDLVPANFPQDKTAIRDRIRENFGDDVWQELQAAAYGPELGRADVFPGLVQVLGAWREMGFSVFIISHKTAFASKGKIPLRRAALDFLRARGILSLVSKVFFVNHRWQKTALAFELGCDVMVDDLPEVFAEPDFPNDIRPILFSPLQATAPSKVTVCANWGEIDRQMRNFL